MTINSDKDNKKIIDKFIKKVKDNILTISSIAVMFFLLYLGKMFVPEGFYVLIGISLGGMFVVALLTITSDNKSDYYLFMWGFNLMFSVFSVLFYTTVYIDKQTDQMDLKPYIKEISSDSNGENFLIKFKKPFQEELRFRFDDSKYNPLFSNKNTFDDFTIIAEKTCRKYRVQDVQCDVKIIIKNKYVGKPVATEDLLDSVYPKLLSFEKEQNEIQSK